MDISVPIVGFIFTCIIFPKVVRNRPQFYMAVAVTLIILVLDVPIYLLTSESGIRRFLLVLKAFLWIVDFVVLILATGGLSLHELGGELKGAYEVMRRGDETSTVIIPRTGDQPKSKDDRETEDVARAFATRAAAAKKAEEGPRSIPLEPPSGPQGDTTKPGGLG